MKQKLSLLALAMASAVSHAGEWDYPAGNETVADQADAKTYVETHYPAVSDIELRYKTKSKLGYQYNFNIGLGSDYKAQRTIVVHTDNAGIVQRVFKSLEDTVIRNGVAEKLAELESISRLKAVESPDISSGNIISTQVNVVDPDLRTMDRAAAPATTWKNVSDYPGQPRFVMRDIEVLNSGGKYHLSNARVKLVEVEDYETKNPVSGGWEPSNSNNFMPPESVSEFDQLNDLKTLTFGSNNFLQVMAFYQIDQSLRYLKSLGYELFNEPVRFDATGITNDNSTYLIGTNTLMLGTGSAPDALDADVVVHELAHGIHHRIVEDWGYGHTGAMAEGFADYWAGSDSYRKLYEQGSNFEIDTVFNWDGYFGTKVATRSLWNQRARYFEQSEYRAHESVGGELGDELWSTPLFQTLKQGVELYGKEAFKEVDTIVLESMHGLGRGMKMHDLVESIIYVAEKLYPGRDYAELFKSNFKLHGLFKEPFHTEVNSRYVDETKPLQVRLIANERQASVKGRMQTSIGSNLDVTAGKFSTLEREIVLPASESCGETFLLTTSLDYQYDSQLQKLSWNKEDSLIYGVPKFDQNVKVQNSIIPDATQSGFGFKTFNFIINGDKNLADDRLAVYLKLNHENMADLRVTLVSPKGTRKDLLTNRVYSKPILTRYWVAKHDDVLKPFADEPMSGTWRLEITDYSTGKKGELVEWAVGRIAKYSCGEIKDSTKTNTENNSNNNSSSTGGGSGGSTSMGMLLGLGFLFWRRERQLSI
ncbi:subtilisin-like proprotein convertase [Photobacterium marinum]|uniref:Subtilisin-like proprotein convertase n=1 Tax=Photobacterium marinum TaxID=1056511 RepID=L8JE05_9GAMM|nr:proprotein convertase P-domain-containing protein [Photobacterium marinum]ELR65637.1 subtilisin-like proprotein convertase [Photobacterium marinum]